MIEPRQPLVYRIDADDRFTWVNDAWVDWARANDAGHLATGIVGSSLWDHVHGRETQQLYRELLHRARHAQKRLWFPYRCDSPQLRRECRLDIVPLDDREIEFRSRILVESPFQRLIELLRPLSNESEAAAELKMCSFCKAVFVEGRWRAIDEAIERLGLFLDGQTPPITQGVCDGCYDLVEAQATG